jgi:uncharacterized protein YbaP (TraB family)
MMIRLWFGRVAITVVQGLSGGIVAAIAVLTAPSQFSPAIANDDAPTHHFLWAIESPTNTVYLLGSIHFLSAAQYPLPTVMQTAFDDAEVVVLEADIGPAAAAETAAILLDKAQPEPGEALIEVLHDETYALAAETAQSVGMPIAFFDPFEPWFYAVSLTSLQLVTLGFDPAYGVDQHFYERAQAADKPLLFLETIEEQLDVFEQLSISEQRQLTEQTLAEFDLIEASFDAMVTAWMAGDTDRLSDILTTSFVNYPQMQQIFLSDRNQAWVSQLETFLQADDDYLVIVGALHLVGPNNVIDLLTERGYNAQQL